MLPQQALWRAIAAKERAGKTITCGYFKKLTDKYLIPPPFCATASCCRRS